MLSSGEISAAISAQNQGFMGNSQFSQSIGVAAPGMGIGMWGAPQHGGGPGAYSYASTGMTGPTYGAGNRFAGGAMSAIGGAASVAGLGLSLMGSRIGMGAFLDPISGAMSGFRAAGLMGGLAGAAVPIAGAAFAGSFVNHFVQSGQQQQMINSQLGQFQFQNPQSRTGMGFTRDDAQGIGNSIRSLAHIPEMLTSVEELTRLLPKLKSSGVMQGVRDATEFAARFKESVKTIRTMSQILGSSMEEAEQFFAHSRSVGFHGRQAQLQNTMNAQFTTSVTGMNNGQFMQMQRAGADMATSLGARRSLGTNAVTSIAQSIGSANQSGRISNELLNDITGLDGPEAIQAAAQQFAGVMSNMSHGSVGRLAMAGLVKFDEDGKAIGLDQDLVNRFNSGGIGIGELKRRAGSLTNKQKLSFTGRSADLGMELAGKVGPGGMGRILTDAAGDRYGAEGVNLLLQRQGMSASGADAFQSLMNANQGTDSNYISQLQMREAGIKDRTDPSAIWKRIKTKISSSLYSGMENMGPSLFTDIGNAYDKFIDDVVGRHAISISKEGAAALKRAMSGGSNRELNEIFAAASGIPANYQPGIGSRFRNSEFGAALASLGSSGSTGRTAFSEFNMARKMLGGDNFEAMGSKLASGEMFSRKDFSMLSAALRDVTRSVGPNTGMERAEYRDRVRGAIGDSLVGDLSPLVAGSRVSVGKLKDGDYEGFLAGIGGREGASALADKMAASGNAEGASRLRGLVKANDINPGGDGLQNMIMAGQGKFRGGMYQVDPLAGAGADGKLWADVEYRSNKMKEAEAGLKSVLGAEGATLMRNSPKAKSLLQAAIKNSLIAEALENGDREYLAKNGFKDLSEGDLQNVRDVWGKIDPKDKSKISDTIMTYDQAQRSSSFGVIIQGAGDVAGSIETALASSGLSGAGRDAVERVRSSFMAFKESHGEGDSKAKFAAARSSLSALTARIAGASKGEREMLLASAGALRRPIEDTLAQGQALHRGKWSRKMLRDQFGLDEDDLAKAHISISGSHSLSDSQIKSIEAASIGARSAGIMLGTGSAASGADPLKITLDKLTGAIDRNSTIVAVQAGIINKTNVDKIKSYYNGKSVDDKGKIDF